MADEKIDGKYGVKNPNEGTDGKLASNVTGESIEGLFGYDNISDRDKEVVTEIIDILHQRKEVPVDMIIEELKRRFELVEIPMKKIEDTVWGQLTKDERIGQSIQGFRQSVDENGKMVRIPHVGFSADLDYLDGFINRLVKKIEDIKKQ